MSLGNASALQHQQPANFLCSWVLLPSQKFTRAGNGRIEFRDLGRECGVLFCALKKVFLKIFDELRTIVPACLVLSSVGTWRLPPHAQADFGSGSTLLLQPYLTVLSAFVDAVPQLKGLKPAKVRVPVGMPGFPKKSFYYHSYGGSFDFPVGMTGVTFNRLYVVTDPLDQVVALQYCCEAPPNHSVRDMGIGIFNFVQFRRKGSTTVLVQYETKPQKDGSVLVITKLGVEERRGSTSAMCKEINVLVLPKPTLQLIDYVLKQP